MSRPVPSSPEQRALSTTVAMMIIITTTVTAQCYVWLRILPRVATSWQKVLTCKALQPFWSCKWPATLPASTAAMAVPCTTQDRSGRQCKCKERHTQIREKSEQSVPMLLLIMRMFSHSASQHCSNQGGGGGGRGEGEIGTKGQAEGKENTQAMTR